MKDSIFFIHNKTQGYPVSLMAFEHVDKLIFQLEELSEENLQEGYLKIITEVCGIEPTQENLDYFVGRVNEVLKDAKEKGEKESAEGKPGKGKRGYYSEYMEYLSKSDLDVTLLNACGFDFEKANYLYTKVDRDIAIAIISAYIDRNREDSRLMLEAAVYGFGGSMGEGTVGGESEDASTEEGLKNMFTALNTKI